MKTAVANFWCPRLTRYFLGFKPTYTALRSADVAVITFDRESRLDWFIQVNHRRRLPTGDTLLVVPIKISEAEVVKREEKRRLREIKTAECLKDEFEGLGNIFS